MNDFKDLSKTIPIADELFDYIEEKYPEEDVLKAMSYLGLNNEKCDCED